MNWLLLLIFRLYLYIIAFETNQARGNQYYMLNTDNTLTIQDLVLEFLEDLKAQDISILDVSNACSFTDTMIIATGTSSRHVKSIAEHVLVRAKENNMDILSHEGEVLGDWALIDLGDAVVHIMQSDVRQYYEIEKLWSVDDSWASNS